MASEEAQGAPVESQDVSELSDQAAEAAVKASESVEEEVVVEEESKVDSDLVDLDGLDKFVFQGKEFTPEELTKSVLMQRDYTKKSQEVAKERKFMENLRYDLLEVRREPKLVEKFKEIYPENYHELVDVFLSNSTKTGESKHRPQEDAESLDDPLVLKKLSEMENKIKEYDERVREERIAAEDAKLDAVFKTFGVKYDLADPDAVILKAQRLLEMNQDVPGFYITDKHWEKLFKQDHTARESYYSEREKKRLEEQVKKGERAADTGAGGQAVGRERKRMTFDEATERMIQDLGGS